MIVDTACRWAWQHHRPTSCISPEKHADLTFLWSCFVRLVALSAQQWLPWVWAWFLSPLATRRPRIRDYLIEFNRCSSRHSVYISFSVPQHLSTPFWSVVRHYIFTWDCIAGRSPRRSFRPLSKDKYRAQSACLFSKALLFLSTKHTTSFATTALPCFVTHRLLRMPWVVPGHISLPWVLAWSLCLYS